jgi:hypothetical protein
MRKLKINFGYFWPSFNNEDNFITRILSLKFKVEISEQPDFYFFTHDYTGKREYLKYRCHRIFLGWENERADWRICDYVLDSDFLPGNSRHKRFPIWAAWNPEKLTKLKNPEPYLVKKKFCCMLVSNPKAKERIEFFNELSKYKKVDSGGKYLNNIGRKVEDKMEFIKDYKFVISFENSSYPGYTTEKIIEPMYANCIPIYWGNPEVALDFNINSFVNVKSVDEYKNVIEKIVDLDQNQGKYLEMALQPWFNNNTVPEEMSEQSLDIFFDFIIDDSKTRKPVATDWRKDKMHKFLIFTNRIKASLKYRLAIRERGFRILL